MELDLHDTLVLIDYQWQVSCVIQADREVTFPAGFYRCSDDHKTAARVGTFTVDNAAYIFRHTQALFNNT